MNGYEFKLTGDRAMKKLITVRANEKSYDILLNDERLDALDDDKCDCLIKKLEAYVTAYQNLRQAKSQLIRAEQDMALAKSTDRPIDGDFSDDIPF